LYNNVGDPKYVLENEEMNSKCAYLSYEFDSISGASRWRKCYTTEVSCYFFNLKYNWTSQWLILPNI
jgi:hypothetical protein